MGVYCIHQHAVAQLYDDMRQPEPYITFDPGNPGVLAASMEELMRAYHGFRDENDNFVPGFIPRPRDFIAVEDERLRQQIREYIDGPRMKAVLEEIYGGRREEIEAIYGPGFLDAIP